MARTYSRPVQTYTPGTYGSYSVNQVTRNDTNELEFTLTVQEDWPTDPTQPVVRVTMAWDTGGGGRWTWNGAPRDEQGNLLTMIRQRISVPREADGSGGPQKRNISGGSLSAEFYQTATTALTIAAIDA